MPRVSLKRFAWLSIAAAVITIGLKSIAYLLTGSVGLFSDALESVVNLIAGIAALSALTIAEKPPDKEHTYGHTKAEYFASISEGSMIILAAITITITAVHRLIYPHVLEQAFLGLAVSAIASAVNLFVAMKLLKAGKQYRSITLEADGYHLLTDVWTSVGVIVGVTIVAITNIQLLDPLIALLVALNIVLSGVKLVRRSALGFMDTAISDSELDQVIAILQLYCKKGVQYHGLRSRQSASRRFVSFHLLIPDQWTVKKGHDLSEKIEKNIRLLLPKTTVTTHLEPLSDPRSLEDMGIDRAD